MKPIKKSTLFVVYITWINLISIVVSINNITDKVNSLPDCSPLPTNWYSGYMDLSSTRSLHYIFIESLDKPQTDPVVVWFNGGPGCSSLYSLFAENGPFIFDDGETVIKPNPWPWNLRANLLYLESPAGVGYSIANTTDDSLHDDIS